MANLNFKDIIQKLSIVRDFSSMLLPIIIGVAAVLLLIPAKLLSSKLEQRVDKESVSVGKSVETQIKNAVPRDQWKEEEKYSKAYANDVNQITFLVTQSTLRPLLSYKLFPQTTETSQQIFDKFGQDYCSGIEKMIGGVNGIDCPTKEEIDKNVQASKSALKSSLNRPSYGMSYGGRDPAESAIVEELCQNRAKSAAVYMTPSVISGYYFWKTYQYVNMDKALEDCWYWQLGYWALEDVFDTVKTMNSGSKSVFESPVKRITYAGFASEAQASNIQPTRSSAVSVRGGRSRNKGADYPAYVLGKEEGLTESLTGRICSEDIDVIDFKVVVIIEADSVMRFMRELCSAKEHTFVGFSGNEEPKTYKHNQITILESAIRSLSRNDQNHELYRYGENAVVELELVCEYVLNKSSYASIEPESVKKVVEERRAELASKIAASAPSPRKSTSSPSSKKGGKEKKLETGFE